MARQTAESRRLEFGRVDKRSRIRRATWRWRHGNPRPRGGAGLAFPVQPAAKPQPNPLCGGRPYRVGPGSIDVDPGPTSLSERRGPSAYQLHLPQCDGFGAHGAGAQPLVPPAIFFMVSSLRTFIVLSPLETIPTPRAVEIYQSLHVAIFNE